jgi:hypothetical protein
MNILEKHKRRRARPGGLLRPIYRTEHCHMAGDCDFDFLCCENFKYHIKIACFLLQKNDAGTK